MNYFAHGLRFVDRPYVLVGTALPDWLSVVDRRVRLRTRHMQPFADGSGTPLAEVAAGVLQHLEDDAWFHKTAAFAVASAKLTILFREALPSDDGHRPAFLGHILTEMLLDAVLIERDPSALAAYYAAFERLDAELVEESVNRMAPQPIDGLSGSISLFARERFLTDYLDTKRLLYRLNQVMRRVKLNPLPESFESALETARGIVAEYAAGLLPGWMKP